MGESIERNDNKRRPNYIPYFRQEEFIVPLLKSEIEENIVKYIQLKKIQSVLDVGCGSSPFRSLFENHQIRYFGFDVNTNENADFVGEIDKELNVDIINNGKYDFILCTEVLEHVANWDVAFHNFYKLLNDDGIILLTAPHFYQLHEEPFDFWRPTIHAFSYFAERNNFKLSELSKKGTFWDILGTLLANTGKFSINRNKMKFRNKIIFRLLNFSAQFIFKVLKSRYLHNNINVPCQIYMSNLVILTK